MNLINLKSLDSIDKVLSIEYLIDKKYISPDYEKFVVFSSPNVVVLLFRNLITGERVIHKTLFNRTCVLTHVVPCLSFREYKNGANSHFSFVEDVTPFSTTDDLYALYEWLNYTIETYNRTKFLIRNDCHRQNYGYDVNYNFCRIDRDLLMPKTDFIKLSHHAYPFFKSICAMINSGNLNHTVSRMFYFFCKHVTLNYALPDNPSCRDLSIIYQTMMDGWGDLFKRKVCDSMLIDRYQTQRGFNLDKIDPNTIFGCKMQFLLDNCKPSGKDLLDIGSDVGGFLYYGKKNGFRKCYGIESTESSVSIANYLLHLNGPDNNVRSHCTLLSLNILDMLNKTDVIVMNAIIHHLYTYELHGHTITPDDFMIRLSSILNVKCKELFLETVENQQLPMDIVLKHIGNYFKLTAKKCGIDGRQLFYYTKGDV